MNEIIIKKKNNIVWFEFLYINQWFIFKIFTVRMNWNYHILKLCILLLAHLYLGVAISSLGVCVSGIDTVAVNISDRKLRQIKHWKVIGSHFGRRLSHSFLIDRSTASTWSQQWRALCRLFCWKLCWIYSGPGSKPLIWVVMKTSRGQQTAAAPYRHVFWHSYLHTLAYKKMFFMAHTKRSL